MLSRVADSMFWMSRYLERAEHLGRLLNATFHLELDLTGLVPAGYQPSWAANLAIMQHTAPPEILDDPDPARAVAAWLTFDRTNPASVLSNVNRARNNARSIRGSVGPDVWRALNELYWQLCDPDFEARARESPFAYYQAVEAGSQRFQGVCDATLPHDEGWQFIQLGKYLERADKTVRTLDVKFRQLEALADQADDPLASLEWAGLLKTCLAYEAYQRVYISRVEPDRIIDFLLLHPTFPRSARFCLEETAKSLDAIGALGGTNERKAERVLGRILADLRYAEHGDFIPADFHVFAADLLAKCHQVVRLIQEQYSLVN
jgi:uncharacterized alpha-E superfamily protein